MTAVKALLERIKDNYFGWRHSVCFKVTGLSPITNLR